MGQRKTTLQTGTWSPTWGYSLQASASMALNPSHTNRDGGKNYWITGSAIISPTNVLFTSASWREVGNSEIYSASISTGSIAKVSILTDELNQFFNKPIIKSSELQKISILGYGNIKESIKGYNFVSSSISGSGTVTATSQSYAIFYVSSSRQNMGSLKSNNLVLSLGITKV